MWILKGTVVLALVMSLGGCLSNNTERTVAGAAVGGVAAAALGGSVLTGAAVGAAGGALCHGAKLC